MIDPLQSTFPVNNLENELPNTSFLRTQSYFQDMRYFSEYLKFSLLQIRYLALYISFY